MLDFAILVRAHKDKDLESYIDLQYELIPTYYKVDETLVRSTIKSMLSLDDVEYFSIVDHQTEEYFGSIEFAQKGSADTPVIGINILSKAQNKGIGTAALKLFLKELYELRSISKVKLLIMPDNKRSIHVFEKLGAVCLNSHILEAAEKISEASGCKLGDQDQLAFTAMEYELRLPI